MHTIPLVYYSVRKESSHAMAGAVMIHRRRVQLRQHCAIRIIHLHVSLSTVVLSIIIGMAMVLSIIQYIMKIQAKFHFQYGPQSNTWDG